MAEIHRTSYADWRHRGIDYIKRNWGWFLGIGIVLMILGAISLGMVWLTTIYSILAFGILMMIGGIIQVVEGIQTRRWGGFFLHLLLGILYVITGFVFFMNPGLGALSLTLLLATFLFASGLFRMISSSIVRFVSWGWTFFSGLVSFILGIMIWMEFPSSALWVVGLFVGIDLLAYGISFVAFAMASKSIKEERIE